MGGILANLEGSLYYADSGELEFPVFRRKLAGPGIFPSVLP